VAGKVFEDGLPRLIRTADDARTWPGASPCG